MSLVVLANLELSIGDRRLLDGANLRHSPGEHVGLVGRNGCGKTTLLRLIAGQCPFEPTAGQLQISSDATVGYLSQDPQLDDNLTLRAEAAAALGSLYRLHEQLHEVSARMAHSEGDDLRRLMSQYERLERAIQASGGFAVEHRIEATLHGVGLGDETFAVRVGDLSGGQRGRLALAKLLLAEPAVLLLDEPTNHLDMDGRAWLEEYLAAYSGAVIVVSHDRWLLDRVAAKIYELDAGRLFEYPGNYAAYREQRQQRRLAQQRQFDKHQERVRREQAFIDRYRAGQRAKQAQGREKRLERLIAESAIERPVAQDVVRLRIEAAVRSGDLVLRAHSLTKAYEGRPLFADLNLEIRRGDRIGVIGPNGCGKTTLVNCLLGLQSPDAGRVDLGAQVDVGHLRQVQEQLDGSLTVTEYLRTTFRGPGATEQEARDLAGAFGFSGGDQDKVLSALSGGERTRTVLAGLVVGRHNLLVLDEPTNHLDIASAEALEQALRQYLRLDDPKHDGAGTLILITHDRMLLEHLVDQLLVFDGRGGVRHFFGRYSDYQAALRAAATTAAPPPAPKSSPSVRPATPAPKPLPKKRKINAEMLEQRIIKLEAEIAAIDKQLADPAVYRDGAKVRELTQQRDSLRADLQPLEQQWLDAAQ